MNNNVFQIVDPDCPVDGFGFLPHASNEESFFLCVHGYKSLQTCPSYHIWNTTIDACTPSMHVL